MALKFNLEDKLEAVTGYLQGKSYKTIAQEFDTSPSVILNWVKQYELNGLEGLNKSYTSYSVEFKLDVLRYMIDNGTSPTNAAVIFKVPDPSIVRKWRRIYERKGIDGLQSQKKGRPSMKKETKKSMQSKGSVENLQEEINRLRMENAYLKKLNTLVQNKEKSPNKTRRK